ncbi:hypothetical protein QBC36DRAFT_312046 [Triangularia setosa]|uniref:Uncharacterized protein n=1 Tax=Triangularia setosa TaxID=2587417 RepID=A0AAN6W746_9PEZI|nr:hypothetical protein QBC36DRAFT_312046 [Podospora setosa]
MTPNKRPRITLPLFPYILWGVLEPLSIMNTSLTETRGVLTLDLIHALLRVIICRSSNATLVKGYLWVMLIAHDFPWIVCAIIGNHLARDWWRMGLEEERAIMYNAALVV